MRDAIHYPVRDALKNDGWTILADPYNLVYADHTVSIDLQAERTILAQRDKETIVVEIKSFLGNSFINEFHTALGQYQTYRAFLISLELDEPIYLAVSKNIYEREIRDSRAIQMLLRHYDIKLIVVDIEEEKITEWIK